MLGHPAMNRSPHLFLCGGHDLEMQTIIELLRDHVPAEQVVDLDLSWGACASAYAAQIETAGSRGLIPLLIELTIDVVLPPNSIVIDHHNERAGVNQPTSLEQIFRLLELPSREWTRWHALVAANDRGYLPELARIGATRDEMLEIRAADRRAQKITDEDEQIAAQAIRDRTDEFNGELTIVRLSHSRTSAVADRMEPLLGGPGYQNLIVSCPSELTLFGRGDLIQILRSRFPDSWCGGALPERGFWGGHFSYDEIKPTLSEVFQQMNSESNS